MKRENAYLTVFLTLFLTLFLPLCLMLIDGVRWNGARLEAHCAAEAALQSVMAEYHRELLEQYNLFAIDSSYGTSFCGKRNTEAHLMEYLRKNLSWENLFLSDFLYGDLFRLKPEDAEVTGVSLLTDHKGGVFRKRAVEALGDDIGLGLLEELKEWLTIIEGNGLEEQNPEEQQKGLEQQIQNFNGKEIQLPDGETTVLEIDNPVEALTKKRSLGILRLVTEEEKISQNIVKPDELVMNRMKREMVNVGSLNPAFIGQETLLERFLFQEYLLRYMGHYGKEDEKDALRYQIEYLIAGNGNDSDNLRNVANRLCLLREAANAMYLVTDQVKMEEIRMAAALACSLLAVPELTPLLEGVIVLGWAYAESIYDVKSLLAGGRIPLIKDSNSWHYGLGAALQGELKEEAEGGQGLSYEDYLRLFMLMTNLDTLTGRAMDMVEADIRMSQGNRLFRLDGCFDRVRVCIRIRGDWDDSFEIIREKGYGKGYE